MLPIGYLGPRPGWGDARDSRLTHDEERTLLTLWSIARSPLILGANLTRMDAFTQSLVTNPAVIAVDQHSIENKPIVQTTDTVVWTAKAASGNKIYIAVFNLGDTQRNISYAWHDLGVSEEQHHSVRDLWSGKSLEDKEVLTVTLAPHASGLYETVRK
jgi:hypothetical protein